MATKNSAGTFNQNLSDPILFYSSCPIQVKHFTPSDASGAEDPSWALHTADTAYIAWWAGRVGVRGVGFQAQGLGAGSRFQG